MTSAMTATSEHSGQALTRAVAGEKAGMDTGPAPLGPILEELVKRAELAKDGVWGHINWSQELSMATGGTNTVFSLTVGAISCVVLYNNTRYKAFASSGLTATLANTEGPLANLANNTVYYVYAWSNSADPLAIKFQISATPPSDVGTPKVKRNYKRGEIANFRYLGFFITGPGGAPEPMRKTGDCYTFATTRIVTTGVIPQNTNLANQVLALGTAVPPHVHVVRGRVTLTLVGTPAIAANTPGGVGSVGYDSDHEEFYADDQGLRYAVLTGVGETAVWTLLVRSCSE